MTRLSRDTQPEAEMVLLQLLRQASPQHKLAMVSQMWQAVRELTLAGLRERHPHATPAELNMQLAEALLSSMSVQPIAHLLKESNLFNDPVHVTLLVTNSLEKLQVPYFLGGSLASAVHGISRATMDADIVADLQPEHAEALVQALGAAFYADKAAIEDAIERRDSFNVIHLATMFKVDVFLPSARPFERAQFDRRQHISISNDALYVASAEDIILAKLEWYKLGSGASKRQWEDVQGVLRMQTGRLDMVYLHHWAAELDISDLLSRALDEEPK